MKKLFLVLALTGMVGAVSASSLKQDDKKPVVTTTKTEGTKDKKTCCKGGDTKTCSKDEKNTCTKDGKKTCCKKGTETTKTTEQGTK